MVRTLPTFLMKKAKQQVLFPLESGQRAQLPTSSPTYYKVTIIYSRAHSLALQTAILLTPLLLHYLPRLLYICLRSRPGDPDVVCPSVSQSVSSNVENSDLMTEWPSDKVTQWPSDRVTKWSSDCVTEWPSDRVTKWPSDRKLRRRLTVWYIYIYLHNEYLSSN